MAGRKRILIVDDEAGWREEILRGLLGSDLIGFHSHGYARHFLSSLLRLLGLEQEFGRVIVGDRAVKVDTFPIGVDVNRFESALENGKVLLMVDVPQQRVEDISSKIEAHKQAHKEGSEPSIPAFP